MSIDALCQWLEATAVGVMVRESLYGFPLVVGTHIMALTLSVGMVLWWDLRLAGYALQGVAAARLYRRLLPFAAVGFTVMFASGAILFVGYASKALVNPFFWLKMSAMCLAGINAYVYHRFTEQSGVGMDAVGRLPQAARFAGIASLFLWAVVIVSGRMMAYTMY